MSSYFRGRPLFDIIDHPLHVAPAYMAAKGVTTVGTSYSLWDDLPIHETSLAQEGWSFATELPMTLVQNTKAISGEFLNEIAVHAEAIGEVTMLFVNERNGEDITRQMSIRVYAKTEQAVLLLKLLV